MNIPDECENQACELNIDDFIIRVSVSMTPYDNENIDMISDLENYFGVLQDATDSYDAQYDILEPPVSAGNWIKLYFPHPEWGHNLGDNFTQDIRSNILLDKQSNVIDWDFNIESNCYGTVNLSFELIDQYCYNCIESIQLILGNDTYTSSGSNINNFNITTFLQDNQMTPFNLKLFFLDSND
tara:strand:+ start:486 stop:1034 length:549 start_codon:yes stop_codon:yes gene_type:complete